MNEILVTLLGWLSDAYSTQLGVVLEKNEMRKDPPPCCAMA
jgi:hypothetical protein